MDVQRLVSTAYPRLSRVDREQMAMDHLLRALDNRALQRHMLTIMPESVVDLVQSVDENLAVGGMDVRHPVVNARVVEAESPPSELSTLTKVVEAQNLLISKLVERVEALEAPRTSTRPPRNAWQPSPSDGCFHVWRPTLEAELSPRTAKPSRTARWRARAQRPLFPVSCRTAIGKWRRPGPTIEQCVTGPTQSGLSMNDQGSRTQGHPSLQCLSQTGSAVQDPSGGL